MILSIIRKNLIFTKEKVNNKLRIALLSTSTINQLEMYSTVELLKKSINSKFFISDFNQYEIDIYNDESELYRFKPEIVFLILDLEELYPDFIINNKIKRNGEIVDEIILRLTKLVLKIKNKLTCSILLSDFLFPKFLKRNLYDHQLMDGQVGTILSINQGLKKAFDKVNGVYIFSLFYIASKYGFKAIYDEKMYFYARVMYKPFFFE